MNENENRETEKIQTEQTGTGATQDGPATGHDGPSPPSKRRLGGPAIVGIAAAAAMLLGGGGIAVGAALADDDRDAVAMTATGAQTNRDDSGDRDESGDRDGRDDRSDDDRDADDRDAAGADQGDGSGAGSGAGSDLPASDTTALREAADAALAEVDGSGVSSIDVERGGYEVEVQLAENREVDVFVPADGGAAERSGSDDADRTPDPVLDLERLDELVDAALAAASDTADPAGGGEGVIDSISASDDRGVAFEITVRFVAGGEVEVDLADDLSVVATDLDD